MGLFRYFKGLRIRPNSIYVHQTGAHINVDRGFFASCYGVVKINIYIAALRLSRFIKRSQVTGKIAFYPQISGPWYNIWMISHLAGLKTVSDLDAADRIFIFDDSTHSQCGSELTEAQKPKAINADITNISKTHVSAVFERIFGYSIGIDPLTYSGPAVQKSDANGTHDGEIVQCPIKAPVEGCAYQRLVDTTYSGKTSEDLRIAYSMGEIAVVFHKHKAIEKRFGTDYASVDVLAADDVFSESEIGNIIKFCKAMGLEFGAVDIMRDKHDGRIYIVDVNKTCMPVLCLSLKTQIAAMRKIAEPLKRQFS